VSLLPRTFERRLVDGRAGDGEPVTVAGVDARRYPSLAIRGSDQRVTAFVVPTSEGVVTVACYAPAETGVGADCDETAGTLDVRRGEPFSLTPDARYGAALDNALGSLQRARRLLRQRLGKARTRFQQQEAAAGTQRAYEQAARQLGRLKPSAAVAGAHANLIEALRNAGGAYRRLEKEAEAANPAGYDRAEQMIRDREADVQGALDAFKPLGYTIT
jgi:hypothetical protein